MAAKLPLKLTSAPGRRDVRKPQVTQTGALQIDSQSMQAAVENPASAPPVHLLALQRTYGNQAVGQAIQRAAAIGTEGGAVDVETQSAIQSSRGAPLDAQVGTRVGSALGADLGGVKVHTDLKADALNRQLSAQAFTTGSHIFFSQGAYQPGTSSGQKLLAHELTHVVQQGGAAGAGKPNKVQTKLKVGPAHDRYEREADAVANHVVDGMNIQPAAQKQIPILERAAGAPTQRAALAHTSAPPISHVSAARPGVQRLMMEGHTAPAYLKATAEDGTVIYIEPFNVGEMIDVHTKRGAKTAKSGAGTFLKVKSKNKYALDRWLKPAALSPNFKNAKNLGAQAEGEESEVFDASAEVLRAGPEGMFQQKELIEFGRAQKEEAAQQLAETTKTDGAAPKEGKPEENKGPTDSSAYTYGQDSMFLASDVAGFAVGAQQIWTTYKSKDMSTWDKVLGISEGTVGMGASAADIGYRGKELSNTAHGITSYKATTDEATGVVTQHSDSVLAGFGGVAGILTAVGSGIKVIKGTTKIVGALLSEEKYSKEEYLQMAGDILSNVLKMAEGIVGTIKTIYTAIGHGIGIHLAQALPGLGIAINGIRIIFDGFYLIKSALNWNKIGGVRKQTKQALVEKRLGSANAGDDDKALKARKNVTKQVAKDAESHRQREAKEVNSKKAGPTTQTDPFDVLPGSTIHTNPSYSPSTKSHDNPLFDPTTLTVANSGNAGKKGGHKEFSAEELKEYRLAKELRDINRKRVLRQSIHISSAVTQIVADGLVLGGITSGAGAGLKAAAAGVEASLPLFRAGKQKFRDTAAKQQAKDKGLLKNASGLIVDPSRSSAAKQTARRRYAIQIIEMAADLEIKDGTLANPKHPKVKNVKLHLKAAGTSAKALARHNGDPEKQVKVLMKALSKREFLD